MLAMGRFLPDFKSLSSEVDVTVLVSDYPQTTAVGTTLSPFVITGTTTFVSTRARGRYAKTTTLEKVGDLELLELMLKRMEEDNDKDRSKITRT